MELHKIQELCKSKKSKVDSFQFKVPLIEASQYFNHFTHTQAIQDILKLLTIFIGGGGSYQHNIIDNDGEVVIQRHSAELTKTKINHNLSEYCSHIKGFCLSIEDIQGQVFLTFTLTSKCKEIEKYFEGVLWFHNGMDSCIDDIVEYLIKIELFSLEKIVEVVFLVQNAIIQDCDLTYDFIVNKGEFENLLKLLHTARKEEYKEYCSITEAGKRKKRLELKLGVRKGSQFKWAYCQLYSKSLDILYNEKHIEYYKPIRTHVQKWYENNNLEICRIEVNLKSLSFLNKNCRTITKGIEFEKTKGSLSFKDIEKFQKMLQTVMSIALNEYFENDKMNHSKIDTFTKEYSKNSKLKPSEYEVIKKDFIILTLQHKECEVWNNVMIREAFEINVFKKTFSVNIANNYGKPQSKSEAMKRFRKLKEEFFNYWKGLFITENIYTEKNDDIRCTNKRLENNPFERLLSIML